MNRRVVAVLAGTVLTLSAAMLCVPVHFARGVVTTYRGGGVVTAHQTAPETWCWIAAWDARLPPRVSLASDSWIDLPATLAVHWPVLIVEQALILLLGGGLWTWVARRERRRRRAEATT